MLTDHRQGDGVAEDRAGVDLTLVLPGVREGHIPDDQLPLPPTQVLPHCQPRVLQQTGRDQTGTGATRPPAAHFIRGAGQLDRTGGVNLVLNY